MKKGTCIRFHVRKKKLANSRIHRSEVCTYIRDCIIYFRETTFILLVKTLLSLPHLGSAKFIYKKFAISLTFARIFSYCAYVGETLRKLKKSVVNSHTISKTHRNTEQGFKSLHFFQTPSNHYEK